MRTLLAIKTTKKAFTSNINQGISSELGSDNKAIITSSAQVSTEPQTKAIRTFNRKKETYIVYIRNA